MDRSPISLLSGRKRNHLALLLLMVLIVGGVLSPVVHRVWHAQHDFSPAREHAAGFEVLGIDAGAPASLSLDCTICAVVFHYDSGATLLASGAHPVEAAVTTQDDSCCFSIHSSSKSRAPPAA